MGQLKNNIILSLFQQNSQNVCVLFVGSIERALNIKYKRDTNGWYAGDAAVMNIFASIWTKNLLHTCQIFHVIYCDPNYIRHKKGEMFVLVIVDVRGGGEDLGETETQLCAEYRQQLQSGWSDHMWWWGLLSPNNTPLLASTGYICNSWEGKWSNSRNFLLKIDSSIRMEIMRK